MTTFKRDVREHLGDLKLDAEESLPTEFFKNPFDKFMLKEDQPIEDEKGKNQEFLRNSCFGYFFTFLEKSENSEFFGIFVRG